LLERLAHFLPNLLAAFALLLIGWFAARILRTLAIRLTLAFDAVFQRLLSKRQSEHPRLPYTSGKVLGSIVFWVVILFFLTAATQVLGLAIFTDWLNRVMTYLPTLLVGGLIIFVGFFVSALARDLVMAASAATGTQQRALFGRLAQVSILVTAIVIGADQIGINVTFLVILVAVAAGALFGGVALAVSLGARGYVANLIGGQGLQQTYRVGQSIRVGTHEGKILELTATTLVLNTAEGRVTLPAKIFTEEPVVLLIGQDAGG
jgi:small-conductance mechanosensitive channel